MPPRRLSPASIAEIMFRHAGRLIRWGFKSLPLRPAERGVPKSGKAPLTTHGSTTRRTTLTSSGNVARKTSGARGGGAMIDLRTVARAFGGEGSGDQLLAPGPYHSRRDRRLSVKPSAAARDGFVCHSSFAGDGFRTCPDHVRSQLGVARFEPTRGAARRAPEAKVDYDERDKARKIKSARAIWGWTINPRHTPGWRQRADREGPARSGLTHPRLESDVHRGGRQCSPGLHAQSPDRGESPSAFFGQGHPHPVQRRAVSSATGVAQALHRRHPGAVA